MKYNSRHAHRGIQSECIRVYLERETVGTKLFKLDIKDEDKTELSFLRHPIGQFFEAATICLSRATSILQ